MGTRWAIIGYGHHNRKQSDLTRLPPHIKLHSITANEKRIEVTGDFALFAADVRFGNRGELVRNLQTFLAYEGSYPEANISGYFGLLTRNAVMKFQKKYAITPVSGYVGYKTRHRMQQLSGL